MRSTVGQICRRTCRISVCPICLLVILGGLAAAYQIERAIEMTLMLTSTSFENGAVIPQRHTCEGEDLSPPLAWSGAPEGTVGLALIVVDPEAPDPAAPKMT